MGRPPLESPAIVSLALFLGFNYLVGYDAGRAVTGSAAGGVLAALLMPFLSLLMLALPRRGRADNDLMRD